MAISLTLLPSARCLFDEPVQVKVAGLRSNQLVTLRARSTDERGVVFNSSASYRADGSGEIDLNRDASLSGSYVGVEPMGLLRSLKADTSHKYFYKDKALEPFMVNFSVHEEEEGGILAEATNERRLIGDGVMRVPVEVGNIQGVLFTPPEGPFPAVLDLGTLMSEKRASLLANKGFIVLALPIFIGKPKLERMNLDDFEEAVKFLQNHFPKITLFEAVVWINGCSASAVLPLYYKNRQILSALKFDMNKVISTQSGAFIIKYAMHDSLKEENKASLVPIERASGQFLFVASEDDFNWDSKAYMDEMVDRLKRHGKENFESVSYPEAGHYLEPPFGPYCHSSFHGFVGIPVLWGGEPRAHAAAEVHLWSKIQEFFRTHLDCDKTETKSKL
uniref:BAAT/Acyl-CoA thioester hydrolase C-terminal domain-containing protein n=1 Tax=Xiphophorus couchianus TaxID=32473 RepID=A0A3B5MCZ5_9TELE